VALLENNLLSIICQIWLVVSGPVVAGLQSWRCTIYWAWVIGMDESDHILFHSTTHHSHKQFTIQWEIAVVVAFLQKGRKDTPWAAPQILLRGAIDSLQEPQLPLPLNREPNRYLQW